MRKIGYILLSTGIGLAIGGISAYIFKRKYEQWALDEINEAEDRFKEAKKELSDHFDFATREIYELREALHIMVDQMQYETILEQVKYKMCDLDDERNDIRDLVESYIRHHAVIDRRMQEEKRKHQTKAESIIDTLGYASTDVEEGQVVPDRPVQKERRVYGAEKTNAKLRARLRDATESALAEAEHPMDDGEGEFDTTYPLAPNGDILDYEEEDAMSDETPLLWSSSANLGAEGDDIKRDAPYIISEWQFSYGRKEYAKEPLQYYALDDTVIDIEENEFDQDILGRDNLLAFETDDCESIFIRNDDLEIDYEVMWVNGSYIHDVLHYPETMVEGRRIWRSWERDDKH